MPNEKQSTRRIAGAISVDTASGPRTFKQGDEAAFAEYLQTEQGQKLDVERHGKDGTLVGFGRATAAEQQARTKNKQRDPESGEEAEQPSEGEVGPMVEIPPTVATPQDAAEQVEADAAPKGRTARRQG
jgi:hypothetical protein